MHLQKVETMRISSNQREALEYAGEELRSLAHLIERILDRNPDASGEELRDLGILWELVLETSKKLKAIRQEILCPNNCLKPPSNFSRK
jgi:hypothetical protein